jgi:hypothetical protein
VLGFVGLVAVLGLVAMHGADGHGALLEPGAEAGTHLSVEHMAEHHLPVEPMADGDMVASPVHPAGHDPHPAGHNMAAMCAAITLAVTAWITHRSHQRPIPVAARALVARLSAAPDPPVPRPGLVTA